MPGAQDVFYSLFNRVSMRSTAYGEPIVIDLTTPPDPKTKALLQRLKPTIILSGPAGNIVIAPYGQATGVDPALAGAGTSIGVGIVAAFAGAFLLGMAVGRRR